MSEDVLEPRNAMGMRAVGWLTAAWAVALVYLCLRKNIAFLYDDMYITLRYSRHVMEGFGPRWNLAGEPVEGFSSPLHMLLVAALAKMGAPLIGAARSIGFASHLALVLFAGGFLWRKMGPMAGVLAGALIAASWPILVWDLGGLDAVLFAATLTAGVLLTLDYIDTGSRRGIVLGGVLLGVAVFTRPDGAIVSVTALIACAGMASTPARRRMMDVSLAAAVAAMVVLPWEIFRIAYYHAPLPNTYYAKVVGIPLGWRLQSGLEYWELFVRRAPFFPAIMAVTICVMVLRGKFTRFDIGLWACMSAYGVYVLDSGGDHMMAFRFMVPLIPMLSVALVRGLFELGMLKTVASAAIVSLALGVLCERQIKPLVDNPISRDWAGRMGEEVARYINAHWPEGSVIAVNVAGTTAFFADRMNFIDMLGLNDREIARRNPVPMDLPTTKWIGHLKADGRSVLARRPEYIIPRGTNGPVLRADQEVFLSDYELAHSDLFAKEYRPCEQTLTFADRSDKTMPPSFEFIYYQRQDLKTPCADPVQ